MKKNVPASVSPHSKEPLNARRGWFKGVGFGIATVLLAESSFSFFLAEDPPKKSSAPKKPVQLHIYIEVKPGKGADLEKLYYSAYVPAIKVQDGFLLSRLLRHYDSTSKYEIDISFKTEKQRDAWAQSKEHQAAWPMIEQVGEKITWQGFDQLA